MFTTIFNQCVRGLGKAASLILLLSTMSQCSISTQQKGQSTATPLMVAVGNGDEETARALIQQGSNVNAIGNGETALQVAVQSNQEALLKLLLANGANVDRCRKGGLTPLLLAVKANNLDLAPPLLQAGASTRATDSEGNTALHLACQGTEPNLLMIELLLASGSDPSKKNAKGVAPVDLFPNMS